MLDLLRTRFRKLNTPVDFFSLRFVSETSEMLTVRQNIAEPPSFAVDRGVMISVIDKGGYGYAATSDLSETGLSQALNRASEWAAASRGRISVDFNKIDLPAPRGEYQSPVGRGPIGGSLRERLDLLAHESSHCKIDDRIVDWSASLWTVDVEQLYLSSAGADFVQRFHFVTPDIQATANEGVNTQTRSLAGQYNGFCQQGGAEILDNAGFQGGGRQVAEEALTLLLAPNCPSEKMDLLLMPDQMMLQIHESIGHPLELDRILGDERNYAGTSFVTLDMFGSYQYGSSLLNVTYDPSRREQFASYAFDDDGASAGKTHIIRNGLLERPLGGTISQARAGMPGVANSRACSWNRPPIDRMANLNVEAGDKTLDEMIAAIDHGVLMKTNSSWSIDDSRNKFQFGCEWGQLIEKGKLTTVVKNPNYRGVSATFWRSLKMVGDSSTFEVMGTPFCGKGEPNQVIRVGHASPACLFANVDVFGGDA
ncbi:MAG TPA: TldD/PmbA family protein [Burkholderiales bacterium]|nr:TldD/PmbA family protein [Burkholderiales bacterium]